MHFIYIILIVIGKYPIYTVKYIKQFGEYSMHWGKIINSVCEKQYIVLRITDIPKRIIKLFFYKIHFIGNIKGTYH